MSHEQQTQITCPCGNRVKIEVGGGEVQIVKVRCGRCRLVLFDYGRAGSVLGECLPNEYREVFAGGVPANELCVGDRVRIDGRERTVTRSAYWLGRSGWLLAFDGGEPIYFWRQARLELVAKGRASGRVFGRDPWGRA